jgi:ribonucleoside-diphosphate reductase alpha chain
LGGRYISPEFKQTEAGETPNMRPTEPDPQKDLPFTPTSIDAPICAECGSLMVVNGSCYKCENCGSTSGCS